METIKTRFEKYLVLTKTALNSAKSSKNALKIKDKEQLRKEFLEMAEGYIKDAVHFSEQKNYVNAFACVNYAHGWLDAGARIRLFDVHDSGLFAVG